VLFGGQGGGGKSAALIMAGLQYVDVPNYSALIIRQNYRHLYDSGGTQEKLEQFLAGTEAQWVASLDRWEFPSGASLSLGFVEYERQRFKFQSTEYQFVAFDELSQWATDRVYRYLFTRMRRPAAGEEICEPCPSCGMTLDQVPIRMRAASNPGGPGHTWLKKRFIEPHRAWKRGDAERPEAPFIQSALVDNPSLDPASYLESLSAASPIERAWMQYGDWDAVEGGTMFKGAWFPVSPASPPDGSKWARYWDLAATAEGEADDPDYTAGALVARDVEGGWWLQDLVRGRWSPAETDARIVATVTADLERHGRRHYVCGLEQEPGSSGKRSALELKARIQRDCGSVTVEIVPATGSKVDRARPVASVAEPGPHIRCSGGAWMPDFLDEITAFPGGPHDDMVDSLSGCFELLSPTGRRKVKFY
jgi:predicted phage terminase large subunit-like protein